MNKRAFCHILVKNEILKFMENALLLQLDNKKEDCILTKYYLSRRQRSYNQLERSHTDHFLLGKQREVYVFQPLGKDQRRHDSKKRTPVCNR